MNVPRGVPADIRKAVFGRKYAKKTRTGAMSYQQAFQLYDLLQIREQDLTKAHRKSDRAAERSRKSETRQRHEKTMLTVQQQHNTIQRAIEQVTRPAKTQPLPPLASPDVVPISYLGAMNVVEWEIGVDYTEAEGYNHKPGKGRSSDVSFNARIFRKDGKAMTEAQVRDVMSYYASEGEASFKVAGERRHHVEIEAVNWRTARGGEREGDADALDNFRSILMHVGNTGLRVGAVKDDEL